MSHGSGTPKAYFAVFGALMALTGLTVWASFLHLGVWNTPVALAIAVTKALLVALIFMHLKWDWNRLYFLIIPAFILGAMMMMVLMPDIVLAWV